MKFPVIEEDLADLRRLKLRSYLIMPLVARERVIGTMTLIAAESGRSYGDHDLSVVHLLTRRVALTFENARLYRQEQERRQHVQPVEPIELGIQRHAGRGHEGLDRPQRILEHVESDLAERRPLYRVHPGFAGRASRWSGLRGAERTTTLSGSKRRKGGGFPGLSLVADSSLNPRLLRPSPSG